ncbi:hypothetical protein BCV70DRAFT_200481 [Testicularia cyperi]|uniref:Sulphur transport domain-containing protein n=1 Tax=Testicularia cyperi TaxID=1882483 RepID=A0A317XR03_9BASI|nr:hypothetical protein BCV70DRAFT_200481 [Testicularia cyperi]
MGTVDFTPGHSLVGGLMMAASLHTLLSKLGMVLGISGFFHTTVKSSLQPSSTPHNIHTTVSRYFTAGLFLGGAILGLRRTSIEAGLRVPILDPITSTSAAAGSNSPLFKSLFYGLLVGLGTKIGNGCTSGHFLCGLSRFSLRSLVATATFFGVAVVTHLSLRDAATSSSLASKILSGVTSGSGGFTSHLPSTYPVPSLLTLALLQIPVLLYTLLPRVVGTQPSNASKQQKQASQLLQAKLVALGVGLHFSFALGISGMLRPSKVLGFLCLSPSCFSSGAFDPSLAMVAIGGILPASYAYFSSVKPKQDRLTAALRSKKSDAASTQDATLQHSRPELSAVSPEWRLPANPSQLDLRLVLGAALFGVGWGATGLCPGPALVSLISLFTAHADSKTLVDLAAFVAAMATGGFVAGQF